MFHRLANSRSRLVWQWLSYVTVLLRVTTRCVTGKARYQSTWNKALALLGMFLKEEKPCIKIQILLAGRHTFIVTTGGRIFCTFISCMLEFI